MSQSFAAPAALSQQITSQSSADCAVACSPVYTDLLPLHVADPQRYPHLLESVAHDTPQARFDILFAFPGPTLTLEPQRMVSLDGSTLGRESFLDQFDAQWKLERRAARPNDELPFHGGWFVYLGYELAAEIEPCLALPACTAGLPTAFATRFPAAVIRDHRQQQCWIVAERGEEHLIEPIVRDLQINSGIVAGGVAPADLSVIEDDGQQFIDGVRRIKRYIRDGDVFQVNLSRAWQVAGRHNITAAALYHRLRTANPAPFGGLATLGGTAIISSSPERLVQVAGKTVKTRPIAGTRPRGVDNADDVRLSQTLLAHPKERAEHIMLIDLERNDLGRICKPGSVKVDELMVLESYAHVHHIVSNVTGTLKEDTTPGQVIRAVFPGGTITGCPKVHCMEIIAELEQTGRGPYTGSIGYINRDGSMDLNILIRTIVKESGKLTLRAGAGIVADSIPEKELEETRAKARGLLLAIGDESGCS